MNRIIAVMIVLVGACGSVASAQWTAGIIGNDDEIALRVGYRPGEKGEIGGYGIYSDGLTEGAEDAAGGGLYATWDLFAGPMNLLGYEIPATMYAGGLVGALMIQNDGENRADPTAALATGFTFGDQNVRIGIEAQYVFSRDQWKELADVDDQGKLLLNLCYRFKKPVSSI